MSKPEPWSDCFGQPAADMRMAEIHLRRAVRRAQRMAEWGVRPMRCGSPALPAQTDRSRSEPEDQSRQCLRSDAFAFSDRPRADFQWAGVVPSHVRKAR
jgi:hypothetical protein